VSVRTSVTVGVAGSVLNDVIMTMGAASARRHNENDITVTIAGLRRYGSWRHCATGCSALVLRTSKKSHQQKDTVMSVQHHHASSTGNNAMCFVDKNSSGDEIANVNFFTTSHM